MVGLCSPVQGVRFGVYGFESQACCLMFTIKAQTLETGRVEDIIQGPEVGWVQGLGIQSQKSNQGNSTDKVSSGIRDWYSGLGE